MKPLSKRVGLFRSIAVYSIIVLVTIVVAELLARVWDWAPQPRDAPVGDGLRHWRYGFSPSGYGDLLPNQDGHWVTWFHRPYHVQTNSVGLRNTEEPFDKAFRILAVGDSQTFGPYLANEDTWPAWTENMLRQQWGDAQTVQVFNAGIASYTILDELAYLKQKGVAFRPQLVILAVYENDLQDLRMEKNGVAYRPAVPNASANETVLRTIGRSSALVSVFDRIRFNLKLAFAGADIRRGEGPRGEGRGRDAGEQNAAGEADGGTDRLSRRYEELFVELTELLRSHDIALGVIFIPEGDVVRGAARSMMEPLIRRATSQRAVPYLDLTPVMAAEKDPQVRFYLLQKDAGTDAYIGNGHLSREGNAVIGRAVAEWLRGQAFFSR